jgi:hypothetical protein
VNDLADALMKDASLQVHVIGGAKVAAEIDAARAIREATAVADQI